MVIIAIPNVPYKMNLKQLVKCLAPMIYGNFEALNFKSDDENGKTAYVRLADNLNATEVINRIKKIGSHHVKAFIPDEIPDLPIAHHPRTIPANIRRKLKIPQNCTPEQRITKSLHNLMMEIQTTYPGLQRLSASTNHQLMEDIGKTVYQRLKAIQEEPRTACDSCYKLTKSYRKRHPHRSDFPLLLSALHRVQDAAGTPRTHVQEKQLTACALAAFYFPLLLSALHRIQDAAGTPRTHVQEKQLTACALAAFCSIPYETVNEVCHSHIDRISKELQEHISNLEVNESPSTAAEAAQATVRKHLKRLSLHIPAIVGKVISNHMIPSDRAYNVVKIYGQPYLPGKNVLQPFTKRFCVLSGIRSENLYNLISVKVPRATTLRLLQADGHVIDGTNAKLVIRPGKLPFYKVFKYMEESEGQPQPSVESTEAQEGGQGEGQDEQMDWAESW